nr:MAG TPA: hypothetical protein [Caudoviricetes sp.]
MTKSQKCCIFAAVMPIEESHRLLRGGCKKVLTH